MGVLPSISILDEHYEVIHDIGSYYIPINVESIQGEQNKKFMSKANRSESSPWVGLEKENRKREKEVQFKRQSETEKVAPNKNKSAGKVFSFDGMIDIIPQVDPRIRDINRGERGNSRSKEKNVPRVPKKYQQPAHDVYSKAANRPNYHQEYLNSPVREGAHKSKEALIESPLDRIEREVAKREYIHKNTERPEYSRYQRDRRDHSKVRMTEPTRVAVIHEKLEMSPTGKHRPPRDLSRDRTTPNRELQKSVSRARLPDRPEYKRDYDRHRIREPLGERDTNRRQESPGYHNRISKTRDYKPKNDSPVKIITQEIGLQKKSYIRKEIDEGNLLGDMSPLNSSLRFSSKSQKI